MSPAGKNTTLTGPVAAEDCEQAGRLSPTAGLRILERTWLQGVSLDQVCELAAKVSHSDSELAVSLRKNLDHLAEQYQAFERLRQQVRQVVQTAERVSLAAVRARSAISTCAGAGQTARDSASGAHGLLLQAGQGLRQLGTQIAELGAGTRGLDDAATVMSGIAQHTNLLALNASIESARAGSAGLGFAEVTAKITSLSTAAEQASKKVDELVRELAKLERSASRRTVETAGVIDKGAQSVAGMAEAVGLLTASVSDELDAVDRVLQEANDGLQGARGMTDSIDAMCGRVRTVIQTVYRGIYLVREQHAILETLTAQSGQMKRFNNSLHTVIGASVETGSRDFDVYRVQLSGPPVTLDPARVRDRISAQVACNIFSGLVEMGEDLSVMPSLALSWRLSEDGMTWRFLLKPGARFHNGREIVAADVKYSLERVMHPSIGSPHSWMFGMIQGAGSFMRGESSEVVGIRVEGSHRLSIDLEYPYYPFLASLAHLAASVVPREEVSRLGTLFSRTPVGSGPFKHAVNPPEGGVRLHAFEQYFEGRPFIDVLEYGVCESHQDRLRAFKAEETAFIELTGTASIEIVADRTMAERLVQRPELGVVYCGFNMQRSGPVQNRSFRRALSLAIDRREIVQQVFQGQAQPADGPIPPGMLGYSADSPEFLRDLTVARRLLAEAGFPEGFDGTLVICAPRGDDSLIALAGFLAGRFQQIGVTATVREVPWEQFHESESLAACDLFVTDSVAETGDPDEYLRSLFYSQGGSKNLGHFSDRAVDELLDTGQMVRAPEKREQIYARVGEFVVQEAAGIFLVHRLQAALVQECVGGSVLSPIGPVPLKRVWMRMRRKG